MSAYRSPDRKRVVIAGGGFAGLWAARALSRSAAVDVLVLDRNNYHTFLPLLYQVAAAELEPEQISYPLRGVFRSLDNVDFRLCCVTGADFHARIVHTDGGDVPYDYLLLAMGSNTEFFGVPGADEHAFRLKSLEQAIGLRNHILTRFEMAAHEPDPDIQRRMLTFTVVGGGPTGVEYAGALAELIRNPIAKDFPDFNTGQARVVLLEAGSGLLAGYPEKLRQYTFRRLSRMGVDVRLESTVASVEPYQVLLKGASPVATETVVWSAGIRGNRTADAMKLPLGRGRRVTVLPSLQIAEHPHVFAAGDLALPSSGESPMIAPNATQQGALAAENILRHIRGEEVRPFKYRDKGAMATIGRSSAVVRIGTHTATGFVAWGLWLFVHLAYLIGFRNRLFVMVNWAWDYLFFERSVRLILPRIPWIERQRHSPASCVGDDENRSQGSGK
ncbi:NAD(P)/FAD-dependent oxidoreductase [Desulfovibrio subterraneus]|uniref:NADH:ubiquinone reductase (non-electrogenic) n=1 Tax=Desulfovibrio subterraneus TaxID=2718620 RepID=A0A7J0BHR1_9BACT|nr:NAD(P)/FAD-dependent oxidoreductase [Desulfovibrio subterraneus]GFM32624.1 pyridine nucleotide-disulfide oxidoreductase [Desulfovibrio subterraneus]